MDIEFTSNVFIDAEAAYQYIVQRVSEFVETWTYIIAETAKMNVHYYPEIIEYIQNKLTGLVNDAIVEGEVSADHWQAWLEEFGKGSEMDSTNPYLSEYISSEYWNPARHGPSIAGRPKGEYLGLDNEIHYSSGILEGKDLELLSREVWFQEWASERGIDPDEFLPTPPTHFLSEAVKSNEDAILQSLAELVETLDLSQFILGG
jgi:hypothetical protein